MTTTTATDCGTTGDTASTSPLVVVVDATNMGHILWHGSRERPDVVEGLPQRCLALHRAWGAYRTVLCFDDGVSFRKRLDPGYKAHRAKPPDALRRALDRAASEAASRWRLPVLSGESLEADDWVASVCGAAVHTGCRVVLVSADKDIRQCLIAGVVTIAASVHLRGSTVDVAWLTAAKLVDKYGVTPAQWVDYQCLVGDTTDGVTGAKGIGPTTAASLLRAAGSLDALLAHPSDFTAHRTQLRALWDLRPRVDLVRQLLRLRTDAPLAAEVL